MITVGEGYINLANCILDNSNVLTITDATIVATSAASIKVSTGFTAGLDKVIGNRVNIAGSSFITYTGSIARTDPVSLIPGSAPGFNGRSTGFSNPDNLENAPDFITDGTGSKTLTDSGKYVESAVPGVNVRKILRRGIDYPNTYYRIYIDPASGDDNNEGQTVATPIKTIEKAVEIVNMHDFGNASSVHLFFLSSFPSNIDVSKFNVIGGPALFITASSQAVSVGSIIGMTNVELSIGNITIIAAENYPCVVGQIGRRLSLNNTSFKINGTYGAIYAKSYENYTISLRGTLTVVCESGNVSNFIDADNATIYHMSNTTINFSTPVNFTDAYIKLGKNSTYYNNTANIIYQNTGNVTGKKHIIESGSAVHNIDLSRLPGTIDGIYCYGTTFTNPETIEKFSEDENGQLLWNGDSISKILKMFSGDPAIYTFSNLDITTGYGIYYMKTTTNDVVFPVANLNEHLEVGREITIYWECGYVNEEDSITRLRFPNPALGEIDFGYTMTTGAKGFWTMEAGTYYFKVYKKPDGILNIMVLPKPQWP